MKKLLLVLTIVILSFSCSEQYSYNYGTINIEITDSYADFENVFIEIESVQILYNPPNSQGQWVDLQNIGSGIYDLIDYRNGKSALIATSSIAPGNLSKIRLTLGNNNSITTKEGTFTLDLNNNSNYEISFNESFEYEEEKTIILDLDIQKSIVELGNNNFQLIPAIRAYNPESSGSIEGRVFPLMAAPYIYVNVGNEEYGTHIDDDGYFKLAGLPERLYELFISPQIPYVERSITNIQVTEGQITTLGDIELENNQVLALSLEGDLNINPSNAPENIFTMETSLGLIDMNVLKTEGSDFNYSGSASKVMVMPKGEGTAIIINGQTVQLDENIRYTFTSTNNKLWVNLRNTGNGNGNWWIFLEGEGITIYPLSLKKR